MKEDVDDAGYFFWHIWTVASFDVNTGRNTVRQCGRVGVGGAARGKVAALGQECHNMIV